VGSLRYLVHTRPDLAFVVGYVSRFVQRPTTENLQAVKRILCYVEGTTDYGLHYLRCSGAEHFIGYSDNDLACDIDPSKSTSGTLFFLGKRLISWLSLKQQVMALSSCEAEYITATTASTQALWLAQLLGNLLGRDAEAVELRVDSKSTLALAKNPHERSKHIFSPSPLNGSSSRSFAPRLKWCKFPRRRHTRLRAGGRERKHKSRLYLLRIFI